MLMPVCRLLLSRRSDLTQRTKISGEIFYWYACLTIELSCPHKWYSFVAQTLALAEHKWSTLNHPNICHIWSLTSSNQPTTAVAMSWFGNGNIVNFMQQHQRIDKLLIVCPVISLWKIVFWSSWDQIKQVASAIAYIHAVGEVHGNIVPVCLRGLNAMQESEHVCGRRTSWWVMTEGHALQISASSIACPKSSTVMHGQFLRAGCSRRRKNSFSNVILCLSCPQEPWTSTLLQAPSTLWVQVIYVRTCAPVDHQ